MDSRRKSEKYYLKSASFENLSCIKETIRRIFTLKSLKNNIKKPVFSLLRCVKLPIYNVSAYIYIYIEKCDFWLYYKAFIDLGTYCNIYIYMSEYISIYIYTNISENKIKLLVYFY